MHVRFQQLLYWSTIGIDILKGNASKSYYVLGYTKSGTNWLCWLVSDYLGTPIHEPWKDKLPKVSSHVFHVHRFIPTKAVRKRTLYLMRDGRDTFVSRYFSIARRPEEVFHKSKIEAQIGNEMRLDNIRENMPGFIKYMATDTVSSIDYKSHLAAFLEKGDYIALKYEDLLADTVGTFSKALSELIGREPDMERVKQVVAKNSFEAKTKRKAGEEKKDSFMRKGIKGDWKNYFTPESARVFDEYAGDLLIQLGYETDHNWVNALEITIE